MSAKNSSKDKDKILEVEDVNAEEILEQIDVDAEIDFDENELLIAEKDKEIEALADKFKRLAAEYDNYRKRTAKEKIEIYSSSVIDIAEKFLPVLDNLDRAADVIKKSDNKELGQGVLMVINQIKDVFVQLGVAEVDCCDEFDPKCHEAVAHINDDSYGENTIAEVFQKGYRIGDRIIRCASVKVAN